MSLLLSGVLFPPALGALILILLGRLLSKRSVSWLSPAAVGISFLTSLLSFFLIKGKASLYLFPWLSVGGLQVDFSLLWDPLSSIMALTVSGVSFLIHIYSVGYMGEDPGYRRYFAYLNLFTFSMLLLVLAPNLPMMFVGWEGVGLCSYLLIGFWFEKETAANAGKKAFIVNRVGDFGFLLGIFLLFTLLGNLNFDYINYHANSLAPSAATAAALLLFLGATGKSAQIPLYIWLPDAMEGPTPVSALIHAATMVTAGVYMVSRLFPLYARSGLALNVVAWVGIITAAFAATIALVQNDIKRVLAYSTISQIGYMFAGVGVGAVSAGMFHLFTHAFFKSLLFLAAGSVIHALGTQDMREMGGLRKKMPITFWVFTIAALAISGIPGFAGFFSKDQILAQAYIRSKAIWAIGVVTAGLTAFYMFRLIFMTFFGEPRGWKNAHESPPVMTGPMLVLAFFSVVSGWFFSSFHGWLKPLGYIHLEELPESKEALLMGASVGLALLAIGLAWWIYLKRGKGFHTGFIHKLLLNKYYVDEIYNAAFVIPYREGSRLISRYFDIGIIDGTVEGSGRLTLQGGRLMSFFQSGFLKDYALWMAAGVVLALFVMLGRAL